MKNESLTWLMCSIWSFFPPFRMAAKTLALWLLMVGAVFPHGCCQHWSYGLSPGGKRELDSFSDTLENVSIYLVAALTFPKHWLHLFVFEHRHCDTFLFSLSFSWAARRVSTHGCTLPCHGLCRGHAFRQNLQNERTYRTFWSFISSCLVLVF